MQGGGILPNLLFFKLKIVRLGSKMDHISAKNIWGYKSPGGGGGGGGKKPIKRRKSGDFFFFFFFLETVTFLWGGGKKIALCLISIFNQIELVI